MTETKTKIRRHFVATFRQPVVTYRENVGAAQPTAVRTADCVIASNPEFSNIVWYDRIHFGVILEWLEIKVTKTTTKIQQIFVD